MGLGGGAVKRRSRIRCELVALPAPIVVNPSQCAPDMGGFNALFLRRHTDLSAPGGAGGKGVFLRKQCGDNSKEPLLIIKKGEGIRHLKNAQVYATVPEYLIRLSRRRATLHTSHGRKAGKT